MGNYEVSTKGRTRLASGALLSTVASAALVAGSLNGMAPANASCVSFFGIGTPGCTSTFGGIAIAIGSGATADAIGLGTVGFAWGSGSWAGAFGALNFALTQGEGSSALAGDFDANGDPLGDFANLAVNFGDGSHAAAGGSGLIGDPDPAAGFGNLAVNLGHDAEGDPDNFVTAAGALNNAWNFQGGNNDVAAWGVLNHASNSFGDDNIIESFGGTGLFSPGLNVAFNTFGSVNDVTGGPGPLAIVGALFVNDQNGPDGVVNTNFGIELRTPLSALTQSSTLARGKLAKQSTSASLNETKANVKSLRDSVRANVKSARENLKANVKSARDNVKKALGGLNKKQTKKAAD